MSDLTVAIRKQGIYCKTCNKPLESTAISEKEAQAILKLIKGVFIEKINAEGGVFDPCDDLEKGYDSGLEAAIKAIEEIE